MFKSNFRVSISLMALLTLGQLSASADNYYVMVTDPPYNADLTGNEDATQAIQLAVNTGKKVVIPKGDFRIDGTIKIGQSEHLHLSTGAWLKRLSTKTDNTAPVVRLTGHYAALTGDGHACGIRSENASGGNIEDNIINNGVVNVGPDNTQKVFNILWWNIDSMVIQGSSKMFEEYRKNPSAADVDKNELLTIVCGQGTSRKAGANYNGSVNNVLFKHGGVGIKLNPISNGHIITNNFFYGITSSVIFVEKCTENLVSNLFVHWSPGIVVIKLVKVGYCHFYGIMAEPGPTAASGRISRLYDIDDKSSQNVIIGHGNTGHASICKNPNNFICDHAKLTLPSIRVTGKDNDFSNHNEKPEQNKENLE